MQVQTSLLNRGDTFFGVCEGLGEDLGIHSNILRLAFAGMLFWNPLAAAGTYAAAGLVVLALRLLVPNPAPSATASSEPTTPAEPQADPEPNPQPLPLAA